MSAMLAGVVFTVVFSIPALVREIRLARRFDRPPAVRGPGPQLASSLLRRAEIGNFDVAVAVGANLLAQAVVDPFLVDIVP
jgi:hypothetical protein